MQLVAAPVSKIVQVDAVGRVTMTAEDAGTWSFAWSPVVESNGVSVVELTMHTPTPAVPPALDVRWEASQRDVHHVWSSGSEHYGIPWHQPCVSEISSGLPLYAFLDANDTNRFTVACSESCRRVEFRSPISETKMNFGCVYTFFATPEAPISDYRVAFRFDTRACFYGEAIAEASDWMLDAAHIVPLTAPEAAFDPVYSTWYTFHQQVADTLVDEELVEAAKYGMKTVILDDGWQIDQPLGKRAGNGYRLCGDWIAGRNFPDMASHVKRAHALGFRYLVWFSVPFVGEKSANYARFKDKLLPPENSCAGGHVMDPRFPEVREFLISTYERCLREWNIDGFKFDFIGRFAFKGEDPALKDNYAGRDIKTVPLAVDRLMTDVMTRLRAIRPDILIEFRQHYIGPCIRKFGNMIRATDCPLSMVENRTRTTRLRLTSGKTAVHSDMLEWRSDETPESAARCILNALFSVVQYSVRLTTLPRDHRRMLAHWIRFSQEHRAALLHGTFQAHYPAADYPLLEGESATERIFGVYQAGLTVNAGPLTHAVYIVNGALATSVPVYLGESAKVTAYDVYGSVVSETSVGAGIALLRVPVSGYLRVERP